MVEGEGLIRDQNDDWWAMPKTAGPAGCWSEEAISRNFMS